MLASTEFLNKYFLDKEVQEMKDLEEELNKISFVLREHKKETAKKNEDLQGNYFLISFLLPFFI